MNANKFIPLALCWMALLFGWQSSSAQNPFELTYDRTGSVDNGKATIELANGNLLIAGSTQNGVNASSGTDGFLTEMNPKTGLTIWSKAYGWGNTDNFHNLIQASDSTIIVVGFANQSVNNGSADMWFLRVDTMGNVIASSTFNRTARSNITEVMESDVLDTITGEPTFLVTGPSANFSERYLARLSLNGNRIWERSYGANSVSTWAYALEEVPGSNDIYLVGTLIIKTSSDGSLQRTTRYTTANGFNWIFDEAYLRPNGNLIATGTYHIGSNVSNDTRPMWIEVNTNGNDTVVTSFIYNTTVNDVHRMNNFQPYFNDSDSLLGFVANIFNDEGTGASRRSKIAYLDTDGTVNSYLALAANTTGLKVFPFSDGSVMHIGTQSNNQAYLVKTDTFMNLDCADTSSLDTTNITVSLSTLASDTIITIENTTFNNTLPSSNSLIWGTLSGCCDSTVVALRSDTTVCPGDSVKLTATGSSTFNQLVYSWTSIGDISEIDTSSTIYVRPIVTTSYVVNMTDTITKCTSSDTVTVIVRPTGSLVLSQTATCFGEDVVVQATGTGGLTSPYVWSPIPNSLTSNFSGETATYLNLLDTSLVTIAAVDTSGCTIKDTIEISVFPLPTITTTATKMVLCNNESTVVNTSSSYGTAQLEYVENNGTRTALSNSYTFTHAINNTAPIPTGITPDGFSYYTFIVEVSDVCNASDTITIIGSNLTASITTSSDPICEGETIQVSGVAMNGLVANNFDTFEWLENGNSLSVSSNNNFSYTPSMVGNVNLDLVVTDLLGCTATATVAYTVNAKPVVAINTSEDTVCVGAEVTLSAISNNATSYIWAPSTLTAANIPATIGQLGNNSFSVAVTNTNGCQDSTTIDIRGVSCCQITQNNEDYLRLDPDNIDPRLADYGIIRTLNGARNFRIINGNYYRLPEHIYLADEVTLFLNGTGATIDLTNADVVFGRNSGIYIEGGNELIANNTVFRPCDETQTWDGIVVIENDAKANFRECTFINPTFGVLYGNTTNGAVSGSLFLNAQHGIVAAGLMTGSISNNVFRVDDNAKNLTYSDPATFGFVGLNNTLSGNSNYYTNMTRYNIQHSGIFTMSTAFVQSDVIISQNEFVNAMSLGTDNPTFNGVLMTSAQGINVSNNSFTNNDISVLVHSSIDISVENNHMEVTRQATSDGSFYQIVTYGPSTGPNPTVALIKGNKIVNSADVRFLTQNVNFDPINLKTLAGTGAIYNYGSNHVRIEDNDIAGFEIGIYCQGSRGVSTHIVNNKIKANIFGIYQADNYSFIGCNEIEMDLDANVFPDAGVVGIRASIFDHSEHGEGVPGIFGNCIRNTNRAIFMESQILSGLGYMHIQNNYLYNYTEAGLYSENFSITGFPTRIRRNAFISNQPNGDVSMGLGSGAFDIVTENSTSIGNARVLTIDRNYFGAKDLMNNLEISTNGGDSIRVVLLSGGALKPFTSCGNMDVTSDDANDFDVLIEGDWMNRCDDESYGGTTPIAQRTSTGTQLNASYQTVLMDLMESDAPQVEGLLIGHIQSLTDLVDVEALYLTAQQLSLSTKTNNWIEYYYQERQGNHTAAQQVLNNMTTETTLEAEEVTVKKAQLDLVVRNARTLTDATLIADLKVIAARSLGTYKHTAREILHNSTNESYTFQYNPVKLYTKPTSVGTKPQVGNNTDIRINPNPATDKITVSIIGNKSVEWTTAELYDIHGRLLLSQPVNAYTMSFDLETLAQGVYVITLKGENGYQTTEKFVKQ